MTSLRNVKSFLVQIFWVFSPCISRYIDAYRTLIKVSTVSCYGYCHLMTILKAVLNFSKHRHSFELNCFNSDRWHIWHQALGLIFRYLESFYLWLYFSTVSHFTPFTPQFITLTSITTLLQLLCLVSKFFRNFWLTFCEPPYISIFIKLNVVMSCSQNVWLKIEVRHNCMHCYPNWSDLDPT